MRRPPDAPAVLSEEDVAAVPVDPAGTMAAVEAALLAAKAGEAHSVPKAALHLPPAALYHAMPAVLPDLAILKWVVIGGASGGRIEATILANDPASGRLIAILGGNEITARRTAAVSAIALRHLLPPRGELSLAIVGCGREGRAHLPFLAASAPSIRSVRLASRTRASAEALRPDAEALFGAASVVDGPEEAVEGADVVLSAVTFARGAPPAFDAERMAADGVLLAVDLGIGCRLDRLGTFAYRVTDDAAHAGPAIEKGMMPDIRPFDADIAALLLGTAPPRPAGRVLVLPPGLAVADAGAARHVLARAGLLP